MNLTPLLREQDVEAKVQRWLADAKPMSQPLDIEILEMFVADRINVGRGTIVRSHLDRTTTLTIEKLIQRNEAWRTAYQNLLSANAVVKSSK